MYSLIAREPEISALLVQFMNLQREYHKSIWNILNELVPEVESVLVESSGRPVYGKRLEEHLHSLKRQIATPIELCICGLIMIGLKEEGLFRIAGSTCL